MLKISPADLAIIFGTVMVIAGTSYYSTPVAVAMVIIVGLLLAGLGVTATVRGIRK